MKYIYSTDGINANSCIIEILPMELRGADKETRMSAGYYDFISTAPQPEQNEMVVCIGFRRLGEDFTGIYKTIEIPAVEPIRYSVRKIIGELKSAGKFSAVRQILESQKDTQGYDWLFVGANYLSSDDKDFQDMCAAIVSNGIVTQEELDELLSKCIWEQTPT